MTEPRDSLRDVLGAHLERAQADAEAERKAAAMLERPGLQAKLEHVAALEGAPPEVRTGPVASERSEHAVVAPAPAATPERSTQRRVAIDPRFDPRLLVTQVKAADRARRSPALVAVALALLGGVAIAWWLGRERAVEGRGADGTERVAGGAATERVASDDAFAPTAPSSPTATSPAPAESASGPAPPPTGSEAPGAGSARPSAAPRPPPEASGSKPPAPPSPTPPVSSYKPLGGSGPVF